MDGPNFTYAPKFFLNGGFLAPNYVVFGRYNIATVIHARPLLRGVHPPSAPGGNLSLNSDALTFPLLPLIFFVLSVFFLFVVLPPVFVFSGVARNVYLGPCLFFLSLFPNPFVPLFFCFFFPPFFVLVSSPPFP